MKQLSQYEGFYWSMFAAQAEKGGYLGVEETANRLNKHAQCAEINLENEDEIVGKRNDDAVSQKHKK